MSKKFGKKIINADYQTETLKGGSVGNVQFISGVAETYADNGVDNEKLPYKVVWKIQHKWERFGDPDSWRREYDLYVSDLKDVFSNSDLFRWPECYYAEINGDETETQLWLEYIDGISGRNLTTEMLEQASEELGRFQGRMYKKHEMLKNITCFTKIENVEVKNYFTVHRPKEIKELYNYIRTEDCGIPKHLCKMIIDADKETKKLYLNVDNMPVVLCHRDFWLENIIYANGKIILFDWDCTGWGYMFEDIIQLITDETGFNYIDEYYRKFIPAYIKGISEYIDFNNNYGLYAWKIFIIYFGYAPVHYYINAKSYNEKNYAINTLQKIYELKDIKIKEF